MGEGLNGVDLERNSLVGICNVKTRNDGVVRYVNKSLSAVPCEVMVGYVYRLSLDFTIDSLT